MSSKSKSKPSGPSLHIDLEEGDGTPHKEVDTNTGEQRVQHKSKPQIKDEGLSTPTLLGFPISPAASTSGAHSSYAEKHHRSRKTYDASSSAASSSKKGKNSPRSSSNERIKDMVSPGALKVLTPMKDTKWSLLQRREMQIKLDLRKSSGSSGPDSDGAYGNINSRRTVKVSARVRGFTKGEQEAGAKRAVTIDGKQISVVRSNIFADVEAEHVVKAAKLYDKGDWTSTFELDSLHWACQEDPPLGQLGGGVVATPQSSQEDIYHDLGEDLVDNVLNGFSSSCFAYGPKDSGKSYSMFGDISGATNSMGFEASSDGTTAMLRSAGLVPRVMSNIVTSLKRGKDTSDDTVVTVSFAEVAHDKVFDMLVDPATTSTTYAATDSQSAAGLLEEDDSRKRRHASSQKALKLREHPEQGVYVENLRKAPVKSSADLLRLLEEGIRRRTDSRRRGIAAHTVVTLELTPVRPVAGSVTKRSNVADPVSPEVESAAADKPYGAMAPATKAKDTKRATTAANLEDWAHRHVVKLHMVDLADAEQHKTAAAGSATASEKRHASSHALRRSLSTLGFIVQSLREGDPSLMLPFRDSSLTWMLRDVLISPGHTAVLACVSPANTCCDDSINTLKFASKMCADCVRSTSQANGEHKLDLIDSMEAALACDSSEEVETDIESGEVVNLHKSGKSQDEEKDEEKNEDSTDEDEESGAQNVLNLSSLRLNFASDGEKRSTQPEEGTSTESYINPGIDLKDLSPATKDALGELAGYNDTLDRIQADLGADQRGSAAARAIYAETVNDPQQRISKSSLKLQQQKLSTGSKQAAMGEPVSATKGIASSAQKTPKQVAFSQGTDSALRGQDGAVRPGLSLVPPLPSTTPSPPDKSKMFLVSSPAGNASPALIAIGDIGTRSLDTMRDKYRKLRADYIELEIELDHCRTDRDSVGVHLQLANEKLLELERNKQPSPGAKESLSDLSLKCSKAQEDLTQLQKVVLGKEESIDRLYDELKAERDHRNEVECEADRQVALLRGQVEVLQQHLLLAGPKASDPKSPGEPDATDDTSAMVDHLSSQLIQCKLDLEARDAEVFHLHERISEIAAGEMHRNDSETAGGEPIHKAEHAQLLAKLEGRDAAIQSLSEEKRALTAHVVALTKAAAATSLAQATPSLHLPPAAVGQPSIASPLREAERASLERMIATQESSLKLHRERWQHRDREQESTITQLKEKVATLEMEVQQEREKGRATQESLASRIEEEVASLRTQVEEERHRSQSEQELTRIEGTKQLHKAEIEVATWKRQHGEIKAKQAQWEAREKSLTAHQEELKAETTALRESLSKATHDVDVHAAERASLQRVIRNQEATIALLGDQQENLKHAIVKRDEEISSSHSDVSSSVPKPPPSSVVVVEEKAKESESQTVEQKLRKQVRELKDHLTYYQGLCEKQKEYIARVEASAKLASNACVAAPGVEDKRVASPRISPRQHSLTLEKLEAAELKAQYWQDLAQKAGVKNASAFASSPSPPRKAAPTTTSPPHARKGTPTTTSPPHARKAAPTTTVMATPTGASPSEPSTSREDNERGRSGKKGAGSTVASAQKVSAPEEPQATVEQLEELAELRHRLKVAQGERERMVVEMSEAKDTMKREYTSLWAAVQDLNELDATKEKAIGTLLDEKLKSDRKLSKTQMQYQKLQEELAALDADLLSTARAEGILSSLNEEKTPTLAKKLKFGGAGPSPSPSGTTPPSLAPSTQIGHPSGAVTVHAPPHPARGRSRERGTVEPEPHYLRPTIASHDHGYHRNRSIKKNKPRNRSSSPGITLKASKSPLRSTGGPTPARTSTDEWAEFDVEQELHASLSELDDRLKDTRSPNRSWQ